ncbi:MAG: alpha/beta hydrolase [Candidatus Heimdallarchaeota archaeon]|nr:alpha/beta hydrolase [Candidatus Heimdallarchaeota archaeon]
MIQMKLDVKKHYKKIIVISLAVILVGTIIGALIYLSRAYPPMTEALEVLESGDDITVTQTKNWIVFEPKNKTNEMAVIFYPGGNVEPEAYAIINREIAKQGYLVIIVKMPFDLAVFAPKKGRKVMEQYPEIISWTIVGHSLGGSMAAKFVYNSPNSFTNLVLLAAYPAKSNNLSMSNINVLSIYGELDGVLNQPIPDTLDLLPVNKTTVLEIEGGNHAYFGSYGEQKGDNPATISRADQQNQTVATILDFLGSI